MKRDLNLDGLKFFLIFCVVLGHMSFNDFGLQVHRMIYSFHMPAFVFLSGYFTSSYKPGKSPRWILETLCIYAVAQVMHVCLNLVLHEPVTAKYLICPAFTLWYLLCLVIWRVSIWKVFGKTNSSTWLIIVSVALSIVSGFIPVDSAFSFQRVFSFFPFFVLGFLFKNNHWENRFKAVPFPILLSLFAVGLLIARQFPLFMPKYHYSSEEDLFMRAFQSVLGAGMSICIFCMSKYPIWGKLYKYGRYTLWIYIGHSFLTRINLVERAQMHFWGLKSNLFEALLLCSVYCFGICAMIQLIQGKKREAHSVVS